MHALPSLLHRTTWTILVILLGYAFGRYTVALESVSAPAPIVQLHRDVHLRSPIVHVREISEGRIVGVVGTGARLVIGETVVIPKPNRTFAIAADSFLVNVFDVQVPDGARYVASRKGKKYYSVESSAGNRLAPQNRLYFRSAPEAEAMGYSRGK